MSAYWDDDGLFWQQEKSARLKVDRSVELERQLRLLGNLIHYEPPPLPNVPSGVPIAIDFETHDPDLLTKGSSWALKRGGILGAAVAFNGFSAYYPIGHREGNVDRAPVMRWLEDLWKRSDITLVMANANYDVGWGRYELDRYPSGTISDVQHIAALLDDRLPSYSLDAIGSLHLKQGKVKGALDTIRSRMGIRHEQIMGRLKDIPAGYVAEYATVDAQLTLRLHEKLMPEIDAQGLRPVYDLEERLIPMSTEMKRVGIRVDLDRAQQLMEEIEKVRMPEMKRRIKDATGVDVEPWVTDTVARALRTQNLEIPKTKLGADSVTALFLYQHLDNPVAHNIFRLRKMSKIASTFLAGHILGHSENGRVHADFNQLRSERENFGAHDSKVGTVTGRYSSSSPNLQQIPVRDDEWGPIMRSMFLPEEGEELIAADYSSQEPRLAVHFASLCKSKDCPPRSDMRDTWLSSAAAAVQAYNDDPYLDIHQWVADLAGIQRKDAKTLNLGMSYGMGSAKTARSLGLPTVWAPIVKGSYVRGRKPQFIRGENAVPYAEMVRLTAAGSAYDYMEIAGDAAQAIRRRWRDRVPFLRGLFDAAEYRVAQSGEIKTFLKRRCRFTENKENDANENPFKSAHKAMNRLCQSSAADQTKTAMRDLWDAGFVPRLTVHDELVFSMPVGAPVAQVKELMQNAITLRVPSIVDVKRGANWGSMKKE